MPHKADVAALVDELTVEAQRLGAVNCVTNRDGHLVGANTDGGGFICSLARGVGFDPSGRHCLVVGAGGAARAVILALAQAGAAEVAVVNRTAARATEAASLAGDAGRVFGPGDIAAAVGRADLVVNATPLGMVGSDGASESVLVDPALLHSGQVAADLVYVPRPTAWLAAAASAGAVTVDGLGMLVHQAALALELWTERSVPVEAMWAAVESDVS
jgi:shikimate dehydrogenase